MSLLSVPIPHGEGSASEHFSPGGPEAVHSGNEMSGYRLPMSKEDDVRKSPLPISDNVASRVWMSHDLSIYSNSEYVYTIFSIAVALFWDQGCREIAQSEPLSTICTILTHCLNATAINNYFVRTQGRWFGLDAML